MFNTNIEWHKTAEELPARSGEYLTYTESGHIKELSFSKKHELFNFRDCYSKKDREDLAIKCDYWAEIPQMPESESEDE